MLAQNATRSNGLMGFFKARCTKIYQKGWSNFSRSWPEQPGSSPVQVGWLQQCQQQAGFACARIKQLGVVLAAFFLVSHFLAQMPEQLPAGGEADLVQETRNCAHIATAALCPHPRTPALLPHFRCLNGIHFSCATLLIGTRWGWKAKSV